MASGMHGDLVIQPQRFRIHCWPYGEVMLYSAGKKLQAMGVEPGPRSWVRYQWPKAQESEEWHRCLGGPEGVFHGGHLGSWNAPWTGAIYRKHILYITLSYFDAGFSFSFNRFETVWCMFFCSSFCVDGRFEFTGDFVTDRGSPSVQTTFLGSQLSTK